VARVVHVHVEDALLDAKLRVDADKLDAVGRMGGFDWVRTKDRFVQAPGRAALEAPR
jgi:flavin reductase (DIM6/NTAB) family NADH-FMN oxidoreductase RutF